MSTNDLRKLLPSKLIFWQHRRYILAIMAFFGFFNVYTLRSNLSIAIVAMTSDRYRTLDNGTEVNIGPEFNWNNEIQGYILSSFFYGYITTQLLGGYLAKLYGGKLVYGAGIAITATLTIVTPWLASINFYLLMAVRIVEGICEGVTYPCILALWSKWAPPLERSSLTTFASSGAYFGTVIAMPLGAALAEAFDWRSIFFFFGAVALLWYAIWIYLVSNSPSEDSRVTKAELNYIETSLRGTTLKNKSLKSVPWKSILTSKAVWAVCSSNFCEMWGFYTFLTQLPKYLKDVYGFNLGTSGFLSGLPYLAMGLMTPFAGQTADYMISKNYLSTTHCRKIWTFLGFIAQFGFLTTVAFVSSEITTVICIALAVGIGGFAFAAYCVNPLDIAPAYASIIIGLSNTFGTMPGIISPILTGYIVSDQPSVEEWRVVFFIAAGIYLFGAIFYICFASGEIHTWAKDSENYEIKSNEVKDYSTCTTSNSVRPSEVSGEVKEV
ncbi:hypothetical protein ABEB36_008000 [Hypothenemus hampei]|uniref:Sialin n=1 Tax=Hypothenemus hampei TaxID=57062 RepID=A0ABD1EPF5_HYPHA